MRNAADMTPVVSYTTLRSRYLKRETAPTTFGPMPMLGLDVETAIVKFCEQQHARGSLAPMVFIIALDFRGSIVGFSADLSIGSRNIFRSCDCYDR